MKRVLLLLLLALPLAAQRKVLDLDAIYDPAKRVYYSGAIQSGFDWIDDTTFVWPQTDELGELISWRVFNATTGKSRPLFDSAQLQSALEAAGLDADDAREAASSDELTFDAKKSAIVLDVADDLYLYSLTRGTATRLTSAPGAEEQATFSPDGQKIAFVRANNLYVVDLAGRERQLTTDGNADILNGKLDWLYQEEIYGRGIFKGYWWSPDSSRIAFLQLDERPVPRHTILDHIPYHEGVEVQSYPNAGDPNPVAKLFITPASGGAITAVDNARYSGGEFLIVNVGWNGSTLMYQVQDREQTWLDLLAASRGGETRRLLHDTTKAWVDPIANATWLADGTFLWQSERSGWRHLYHYKADGTLIRQITNGEWEVRDLHGVDEKNGFIYFSGTERSPIGQDVYRVKLDGSGLQRLSGEDGTHTATFNPSMTMYVDKWSDIATPDQIRLYRADGKLAQVVFENKVAELAALALPRPQFLQVKTRDGFVMEAMMIKPANFDPAKKYPVYQHLYGGPHTQTVRNAWGGQRGLFHQFLAQHGVLVWECDNRTASGKGAVSTWPMYKNAGESELRDIEDGVAWLAQQPYVDASRVMLNGWSYGGFMVSYALTHSTKFAAGIAGGSVTDWRDYDSVYTERYMLMPQHNEEGYKKTAPRWAAKNLHGNLLLLHGTTDDNVHLQNTIQFAYELEKEGKLFSLQLYPRSRHGVTQKPLVAHLQRTIWEFVRANLLGSPFAP
ncbi:MAG: DPP IV N-terminal domain-containing protein [Acidobacteria bacterium]|nr:DPP IV N-terminal domain-containing protein [Acidobacteriota bacterium]MBV9476636.1 DPP IV N-terminal domain-containing protein [Acidobacteriota bacterium]